MQVFPALGYHWLPFQVCTGATLQWLVSRDFPSDSSQ